MVKKLHIKNIVVLIIGLFVLPVGLKAQQSGNAQISYFNGTGEDKGNAISWSTITEKNTDYFSVERSCDRVNWEEAFKLKAEGNSTQQIPYSWTDDAPYPGVTYYRIKTVYGDGTYTYSTGIVVESKVQIAVDIAPNPSSGVVKLTIMGRENETSHVYIKNMMGAIMFSTDLVNNTAVEIDIEGFPEGIYSVNVESKSGSSVSRLIKR